MREYTDGEIEAIARVCHEANMALQFNQEDEAPSLPWNCESEHIRASAMEGVRRALFLIGLGFAGPDTAARIHHENWVILKEEAGWEYGETKDPEARPKPTHPCMVPWGKLPREQKLKSRLFLAVVKTLAEDEDDTAQAAA